MQVAKWGNSLAVRLPSEVVEALKLKEGDQIEIRIADEREFEVRRDPAGARSRTAHAQQRLISRFGAEQWLTAVDSAYRAAVDRASRRRRH